MFFLAMLWHGMHRSIAEELLLPSLFLFLSLHVFHRNYVSSRFRGKNGSGRFSPAITSLVLQSIYT